MRYDSSGLTSELTPAQRHTHDNFFQRTCRVYRYCKGNLGAASTRRRVVNLGGGCRCHPIDLRAATRAPRGNLKRLTATSAIIPNSTQRPSYQRFGIAPAGRPAIRCVAVCSVCFPPPLCNLSVAVTTDLRSRTIDRQAVLALIWRRHQLSLSHDAIPVMFDFWLWSDAHSSAAILLPLPIPEASS